MIYLTFKEFVDKYGIKREATIKIKLPQILKRTTPTNQKVYAR